MTDAEVLRRAAVIIKAQSTKKRSIWLGSLLNVLNDLADHIESQASDLR